MTKKKNKTWSVVLRVEHIYEVEAQSETGALNAARYKLANNEGAEAVEEADDPTVSEMG